MRLDQDHVGFFLADAAGHGVPAALMTMYIKRALHAKEEDEHLPNGYRIVPANEAIGRLNDDMVRQQTGKTGLATACYGVCNCRTLEMTLARAGHPFPMLLKAGFPTAAIGDMIAKVMINPLAHLLRFGTIGRIRRGVLIVPVLFKKVSCDILIERRWPQGGIR